MTGRTYVSATHQRRARSTSSASRARACSRSLRDELRLTGSKEGCNNGNCGACNVILNGALVNSCCVLGVEANGGDHRDDRRRRRAARSCTRCRQSFLEDAALQCGICTPGFIVAAKALLDKEPDADEARIRHWLAGNLCRCTGYDKIVRAVLDAADVMRQTAGEGRRTKESTRWSPRTSPKYKVIGTRPVRPDGVDKVTGRAQYGADIQPAGHAARAHDAQPARARHHQEHRHLEGAGARRREGRRHGAGPRARRRRRRSCPTRRRTSSRARRCFYRGHAVAAVAAINDHIAQEAREPHRGRVRSAAARARRARGDAPRRADPARGAEDARPERRAKARRTSSRTTVAAFGDVEKGFAECDVIVESEFSTKMVHQGYIEPQACDGDRGTPMASSRSGRARRARSRRARRARRSSATRSRRSRSSRRRSAAASAARSASTWSPSPRCSRARPASPSRCAWTAPTSSRAPARRRARRSR